MNETEQRLGKFGRDVQVGFGQGPQPNRTRPETLNKHNRNYVKSLKRPKKVGGSRLAPPFDELIYLG